MDIRNPLAQAKDAAVYAVPIAGVHVVIGNSIWICSSFQPAAFKRGST